ncbi:MAG: hypothetical protein Q4D05_04775 [Acinetobacter sp.]|nr:hypothetical protein [Acinetobacter sp.]
MNVDYSRQFKSYLKNFPVQDQLKIRQFVEHVEKYGFQGLQGRNKSSDTVPKDDPKWVEKVSYAQKYRLWHYHIGIPAYVLSAQGDFVSEYILHYMRLDDAIKLVSLSYHPPFTLPQESEIL